MRTAVSRPASFHIAIAACVVLGMAAVSTLVIEGRVARAQTDLKADMAAIDRGVMPNATAVDPTDTPRVLLIDAIRLARMAAATPDPRQRAHLLATASTALSSASAARPDWGETEIVRTFIASIGEGGTGAGTLAALAHSYRELPYARDAAGWRIATGIAAWDRLDEASRKAVIDEAVWYSGTSFDTQAAVFDLVRSSPAYSRFMLRWRDMRLTRVAA